MDTKNILTQTLEKVYSNCFGNYSKHIIQERSLPDIRDGLKPVQRRILFTMHQDGNTHNKPFRKSAKTVGSVMGQYHPHGDSSIYDAIVRMSQSWKNSVTLIDMHGNNGSIDNDPAAAMRYTEARLSKISDLMLKNIDKETVSFAPNYDDSLFEPTVLPALFPNLLVNGAKGIAAGYATEIPPHNLGEVIDATIHLIKHPKATVEDLMKYIKGPDFPTGAIVQGKEGLVKAYNTGSGAVKILSKTKIVEEKNCVQLVITEIPFEVVKSQLVMRIDSLRFNHTVDGIIEVRDESDRSGLKIVVDIRKEADVDAVVSSLMKLTDLQISYNFNMVTIVDNTPKQLGINDMLNAYVKHQIEVLINLTKFDLKKAKERLHIVKALIIALTNLDEVIEIIRRSHGKQESKQNLEKRFGFDDKQSEAIVMLNLYRLNSTDIEDIKQEGRDLEALIKDLEALLVSDSRQRKIIANQLEQIKKDYATPRLTEIQDEITNFVVERKPIIKEDVQISITKDGYIKRSSLKSYNSSEGAYPKYKNTDMLVGITEANTADVLLAFTNKGNYLYLPVFEFPEMKWKDEGNHLNSIITMNGDEKIVKAFLIKDFEVDVHIIVCSHFGQISRIKLNKFVTQKYNRPLKCMKISNGDYIVGVGYTDGDSTITISNDLGKGYKIHENAIPSVSLGAKGVIALKNSESDNVGGIITTLHNQKDNYVIFSKEGAYRIFHTNQLEVAKKCSRCYDLFKFYKTEPHRVSSIFKIKDKDDVNILYSNGNSPVVKLDDYHHSPCGKIMKTNLPIEKGVKIEGASNFLIETIDSKIKTYYVEPEIEKEIPLDLIFKDAKVEKVEQKVETKKEEPKEEEQLSIFDDMF